MKAILDTSDTTSLLATYCATLLCLQLLIYTEDLSLKSLRESLGLDSSWTDRSSLPISIVKKCYKHMSNYYPVREDLTVVYGVRLNINNLNNSLIIISHEIATNGSFCTN